MRVRELANQKFMDNVSDAIQEELEDAAMKKQLINIPLSFRGFGKTVNLVELAKKHNLAMITPEIQLVMGLRKEFDYDLIFPKRDISILSTNYDIKDVVIDEGIDFKKVEKYGLNIITGFVNYE